MSDEPLLTWKGRRVRSPDDGPASVARKVPEAPRPGSLFFVPSPLEGWGLETLLARLPADGVVVVFEKDEELTQRCAKAWRQHLGESDHPQLFRLEVDTEEAIQSLFRRLPLSRLRRCEFLTLNGAWLPQGARYREVFTRLEAGLNRWWSNRFTCVHMGPLWLRNFFDNLARRPSFRAWPTWGRDTVLVCGAGVTVEQVLPWAKFQRTRLRILAADTALPILQSAGLVPDAVVCLEAQHANLRDFAGWKGADVTLFTDLTSFPPGSRVFSEEPCWFISEFAELELWERWPWPDELVPRLPPLGSVGVAATWLAWRLTTGAVILAGLDFSYPPGKTHARGAPSLSLLAARASRLRPLEQVGSWAGPATRHAGGWLTTAVMEGYAGVLREHSRAQAHRTFVWSLDGLPLGLALWQTSTPLEPVQPSGEVAAPHSLLPGAWLKLEGERWHRVLELFEELNRGPTPELKAELERQMRAMDYLTFCFPDPEYRAESDWLIRAQAQIRWLVSRLRPT